MSAIVGDGQAKQLIDQALIKDNSVKAEKTENGSKEPAKDSKGAKGKDNFARDDKDPWAAMLKQDAEKHVQGVADAKAARPDNVQTVAEMTKEHKKRC